MKTAQIIAQNAERNAEGDSGAKPEVKHGRGQHPNSRRNLVAPWTPGTAPKSAGRPRDTAADISRAAFENNQKAIYEAVVKKLLAGDAYAFSVHGDRGYGKLTDRLQLSDPDHILARLAAGRNRLKSE